jgi:hypothetical protein
MDLTWLIEKKRGTKSTWYEDEAGHIVAKVCTKCETVKSLDEYPKLKIGIGGRNSRCKPCRSLAQQEYYADNRENYVEYHRKRSSDNIDYRRNWYTANSERVAERNKIWRRNNPNKRVLYKLQRRARIALLPDNFTQKQQVDTLEYFGGCALTGSTENIHWEHAIPLSVGHGGTTRGNMYPMSGRLNNSKWTHNIFEWFTSNKERFNLSQTKFDELIEYLAQANEMTTDEYREYVYWCHRNKKKII